MNLYMRPAGPGLAYVAVVSNSPLGAVVLGEAVVPLDSRHAWTRSVADHFTAASGGEITVGRVLAAVRAASTAELAAGWRP